jgi:hypothetical protein
MLRIHGRSGLNAALAVTLALAGAGCSDGQEAGGGDRVSVVHEGGVEIVEVAGLWTSDWPELPGVTIDTLVSPEEGDEIGLMAPLYAALLPDGGLAIGDVGTRRVWRSHEGGEWTEVAGPGQGPGELRGIGGVWARDAGLVVFDPVTSELVHFDDQGRHSARHSVRTEGEHAGTGGSARVGPPTVQALGEDEWLLAEPAPPEPEGAAGVLVSDIRFFRVSESPALGQREVGGGRARPIFVEGGGGAPIPFAATALVAGAGGRVALFEGDRPEVEVSDGAGIPRMRVRWDDDPMPLGPNHRGALGDFMRQMAGGDADAGGLDAMIRSLTERIPLPETLPHLGDLRLGQDGAIWLGWPERSGLELPTEPERIGEWRVVIPANDGAPARVYRVGLPTGTTLLGPIADLSTPADGAFLLLLRGDLGRQGLAVMRTRGP